MDFQKPSKKNIFMHLLRNIKDSNNGIAIMFKESSTIHRIYPIMIVAALALGIPLKFIALEWIILIILFLIDFITETMNSSVEEVADRITLEQDSKIKRAKDIASAAVYVSHLMYAVATILFAIFHATGFTWWTHIIPA